MLLPKAAGLLNFQQVAVVALLLVPSPALCPSCSAWSLWSSPEQRCCCFSYQTGNNDQTVFLPGRRSSSALCLQNDVLQGSKQPSRAAQLFCATGSGGFSSHRTAAGGSSVVVLVTSAKPSRPVVLLTHSLQRERQSWQQGWECCRERD